MKSGRYRFPDRGIEKASEYIKQILKVCPDEVGKDVVADALGMSVKSGAFFVTLASLNYYHLIEVGGKKIKITDLGKKIRSIDPNEVEEAKIEAVRKIEIFSEIYAQYGEKATIEQLRAFLREKAGEDRLKAERKASELLKVYKEAVTYLKLAEKPKKPTIGEGISRRESVALEQIELRVGEFYQKIPCSIEGINMARTMLNFLENQISKKEVKKEGK